MVLTSSDSVPGALTHADKSHYAAPFSPAGEAFGNQWALCIVPDECGQSSRSRLIVWPISGMSDVMIKRSRRWLPPGQGQIINEGRLTPLITARHRHFPTLIAMRVKSNAIQQVQCFSNVLSASRRHQSTCVIRSLSPFPTQSSSPSARPRCISYVAPRPRRIVIGITGATGTVYAIRLLETLRQLDIETHLVMSKWALATLKFETPLSAADVASLATKSYSPRDVSADIASGSYLHDGMIIVPCSMKTLAAVRCGFGDDLIARAADVTMKEGRRLVLVVRETPLSEIHLENMLSLRRAGAIIFPPMPAFYTKPQSMDELVNHSVGRMLDSMGIHVDNFERWTGFGKSGDQAGKAR
ncbi:hypothetical protein TI39_contig4274g00003 [Zymoseptoria brevis]|uniref:Flavin prenyltransferase PAD1, mitochondrial n=1 Tax=Zymoseptoria brevis TaxID=1047168 RepID=A0A0F4GBU7_9PEZI|nr:hypothetical protein TI39_contig4274g00003 [Zymoseptoria brevis]